jgi:hypothetical protein
MLTCVTALIALDDYKREDYKVADRIEHFKSLAATGIPICIYASPCFKDALEPILQEYSNLKVIQWLEYEEMGAAKIVAERQKDVLRLPVYRTEAKDTMKFMTLMNNKVFFLKDAMEKNPFSSTHFAWIDFGIGYIFRRAKSTYSYLASLAQTKMKEKFLAIPGCWNKGTGMDRAFMSVNWRFCGGFFVGDKTSLGNFCNLAIDNYESFLTKFQCQIWEVNYWAFLEQDYGMKVNWYHAGHDDSIIEIPQNIYMDLQVLKNNTLKYNTHSVPELKPYRPSSVSFLEYCGVKLVNTRYVNYELTPKGYYIINHPQSHLDTVNCLTFLNDNFSNGPSTFMRDDIKLKKYNSNVHGLEDIRLFNYNEQVYFLATQREYSSNGKSRMMMGVYDLDEKTYRDCVVLEPPTDTYCEKNWIPLVRDNELYFIYGWSPIKIGKLNADNKLEIVQEIPVPAIFGNLKGSTSFVPYNDELLGVVHYSIDGEPRKYYHRMLRLNKDTLQPIALSSPFVFEKEGIEYCIGFTMTDTTAHFWYSQHDCNPAYMEVDVSNFSYINV